MRVFLIWLAWFKKGFRAKQEISDLHLYAYLSTAMMCGYEMQSITCLRLLTYRESVCLAERLKTL